MLRAFRRLLAKTDTDIQEGNRLFAGHKYEAALDVYLRHARECPSEASDALAKAAKCCRNINVLTKEKHVTPEFTLVFQGDRQAARELYQEALRIDPDHYESLLGLADLLPDRSDERLKCMERAVAIQPRYLTLIDVGDFYRSVRHDNDVAYESYKRAVKLKPREKTAYQRLSDICKRLGREAESREWHDKWKEVYATKKRFD